MRKAVMGIGGLIAAAGTALTLAGASPAFASTVSANAVSANTAAKTTGPEVISGAVYGKAAVAQITHIPLTFAGVVATADRGFVLGNGNSNTHTLTTPAGRLTVTGVGQQAMTQTMNARTCYFTFTTRQRFTFVPGQSTGRFAGASGPGAYQVYFAAYGPRYRSGPHRGQCDTASNAQPLANGAVARFLAAGVLTLG